MASNIKFGVTEIGDLGGMKCEISEGVVRYTVVAEKKVSSAKDFRDYITALAKTIGCDDVQVVSFPRAKGVIIYSSADKEDLEVDGVNYGEVASISIWIQEMFNNGYGRFEIVFQGSN